MAMLVLPEVFERTWGHRAPLFWPRATQRVRERVPGFCFMAEVYWDLEWTMLAAGVRLRLRQAAVRPPARGARAAGARAPSGRARLPEQARPVPGKPRRAAGGGHVRAGHARGRGRHHVSVAGPAVLPSGAVRGPPQAHLAAPGPRAAGAGPTPRCTSSTAISWRCSGSRSFATASGACSTAPRPGTATGRGSPSSPGPGTLETASSG